MSKRIIRNGVKQPPKEAYECPCCNKEASIFKVINDVPTFSCSYCDCVWQWEDEPERPQVCVIAHNYEAFKQPYNDYWDIFYKEESIKLKCPACMSETDPLEEEGDLDVFYPQACKYCGARLKFFIREHKGLWVEGNKHYNDFLKNLF